MEEPLGYGYLSQRRPTPASRSFPGPYVQYDPTHYYPSSPALRPTISARHIAQPHHVQPPPQGSMQALIQYKRHGSAALIGVAVLHLAADTNFAGFVKCVKELASSGLFDIQTDAEGEEIVFRSAFVRWALGQELDENRYDSPVRDDVELELVLKMMGKRGWMDHFVVFYDVVVGRRRNTADIVVTNTDGAGTPRTACGEGGLWPDL